LKRTIHDRKRNLQLLPAILSLLISVFSAEAAEFIWPLKTSPGLAASFCEYRPRHFHGGVDMKTWGVRSVPCLALADGVVSRIKVQPGGYGKALYLTLPTGETAVYAHLDRFAPPVADKVRAIQEATGSFEVDLFWEGDSAIPYRRGDVVAHSGVTGTVHPHLHFEIRDANQGPMNPLTHGVYAEDHIAPIPVALAVSPLDAQSTVEGDYQPRLYARLLKNPKGVYEVGDPIGASGRIGIAVDAYDQADGALNEMAVYSMELSVAGEVYWTTEYENFDFAQTRMIEIERDYRIMRRGKGIYHRLYRMQGNKLRMLSGDGVIDAGLADPYPIPVEITFADVAGNQAKIVLTIVSDMVEDSSRSTGGSPLISGNGWSRHERGEVGVDWFDGYLRLSGSPGVESFRVTGLKDEAIEARSVGAGVAGVFALPREISGTAVLTALSSAGKVLADRTLRINYAGKERQSRFASDDSLLTLSIPPESLYDETWFQIERDEGYEIPGQIESVFRFDPRDQPLASPVKVGLRRSDGAKPARGWCVYYFNARLGWTFLGSEWSDDYMKGDLTSWDRVGLLYDSEPPSISVSLPKGTQTQDRQPEFSAVIKDSLSGISYSGIVLRLNGRKVPVEYDQPRARTYYRPWKPLPAGEHLYEFEVTDRAGNSSKRSMRITVK